jgi:tetratricopeptide (TPR) repeat protein
MGAFSHSFTEILTFMAKRKQEEEVVFEEVTQSSNSFASGFLNQKTIAYILGGLALLFAGYFAYKQFVVAPQQQDAVANMWKAQQYFERDSFQLALESPIGDYDGFESLISKYGSSKAGNSARYYAGICYLNLGQYDKAIERLDDFSPSDTQLEIMKYGALGDCYSEQNDLSKALSSYDKAISAGENELLTAYYLKKAGMLCEYQKNQADAAKYYQKIKSKYPQSPAGSDIDKYLARVGITE